MKQQRIRVAPHLRTATTTRSVMADVAISLLPALAGSIWFFGLRSLWMTAVSVTVCVGGEYLWQKVSGRQITAGDFSAVVTGMLLAFNFPVTVPLWVLVTASLFAILVAKQMFGGIGNNFANPALMGRLLVMTLWPAAILSYPQPFAAESDAITSPTVLAAVKSGMELPYSHVQMFLGEIPGAIGETSKLLLLIGFAYLCYRGIVNASISLSFLITVSLLSAILGRGGILTNLLSGSLILGGCYMLTDYAFATKGGRILFGVIAGIFTVWFRVYSRYPEGVCFGILTANCLSGLLAGFYRTRVYGVGIRAYKNIKLEKR